MSDLRKIDILKEHFNIELPDRIMIYIRRQYISL